jgi:hypothetical protein
MSLARTGIAGLGLIVFGWGILAGDTSRGRRSEIRLLLLFILACVAFASYYQFFRFSHARGFTTTDNFHYYMGSKYFSELGYFGLYECTLVALTERGMEMPGGKLAQGRSLRSMQTEPLAALKEAGKSCPDRFGKARWKAFADDSETFFERWPPHLRRAAFLDHGYHPSPIWTLFGSSVASLAPATNPESARLLARIDRMLILFTLLLCAFAFGIETACLIALLWGTGFLWRYVWVGDAFLRHLWWIAALGGLMALRRGLRASAGAALATSTLLRLFPGALGLGYLVGQIADEKGIWPLRRDQIRFVAGAGLASAILIAFVISAWGPGISVFVDFGKKIGEFSSLPLANDIGLGVAIEWLIPENDGVARSLTLALALAFLWLFWRSCRHANEWESTALGACLIPILTNPTNYYCSYFILLAPLSIRRPLIGAILLAAGVAWNLNGLYFYQQYAEFDGASGIAILVAFGVVLAMRSPVSRELGAPRTKSPMAS